MELQGDMGLVARFDPYGDTVGVSAKLVHGLRQTYHGLRNYFGRTFWYS
jgi:hypothetical protein